MKRINILCNNKKESYDIQKILFEMGYYFVEYTNPFSTNYVDIEDNLHFDGYPVVINTDFNYKNTITFDTIYKDDPDKHKDYYNEFKIITYYAFTRKYKLKNISKK